MDFCVSVNSFYQFLIIAMCCIIKTCNSELLQFYGNESFSSLVYTRTKFKRQKIDQENLAISSVNV